MLEVVVSEATTRPPMAAPSEAGFVRLAMVTVGAPGVPLVLGL